MSLSDDRAALPQLLELARGEAERFLNAVDEQPVAHRVPRIEPLGLPDAGLGAAGALEALRARYAPWMSGSPGPRYFAFVTGGTTPAALLGDWLTAAYDQNLADAGESASRQLTLHAVAMFRALLGVPDAFDGVLVTGATASAITAMATARQWVGRARGVDTAAEGVHAAGPVRVLSGTPHASIFKALSVTGMGRGALRAVPTLPGREAVDVDALAEALARVQAEGEGPAVVVANAGTVNTGDFDDLAAVGALKARFPFWLHVDGAFGAVAAASPRYRDRLAGIEAADSLTVDGHKWLNVPYESAVLFTRHLGMQGEVFRSAGAYLPAEPTPDTFIHLTPENSQRLRALPLWMTLAAYGREGYAQVVERCCDVAAWLGERIGAHPGLRLLAPVRLNVVCFTLAQADGQARPAAEVQAFLDRLAADGTAFLTPTTYAGVPAARIAVSNWRTTREDAERTWAAMERVLPG